MSKENHDKTCPFCRGMHWHKYQSLESKMVEITKYVTLDETNSQTWGVEIADILVLTGNAMDTFFRDMRDCPNIGEDENFLSINKPRKGWNIQDYQKVFERYYEISQNSVYTGFGLGNAQTLVPFKNFDVEIPKWWTAYNTTKHAFYSKMNEANLGNALNCLAGLLILNSLHLCSSYYLSINGKVSATRSSIADPSHIQRELTRSKIGVTRWGGNYQIATPLFIFTYLRDETIDVSGPPLLDFVNEGRYTPTE